MYPASKYLVFISGLYLKIQRGTASSKDSPIMNQMNYKLPQVNSWACGKNGTSEKLKQIKNTVIMGKDHCAKWVFFP